MAFSRDYRVCTCVAAVTTQGFQTNTIITTHVSFFLIAVSIASLDVRRPSNTVVLHVLIEGFAVVVLVTLSNCLNFIKAVLTECGSNPL